MTGTEKWQAGRQAGTWRKGRQVAQGRWMSREAGGTKQEVRARHVVCKGWQVSALCFIKVSLWKKSVEGAGRNRQVDGGEKSR